MSVFPERAERIWNDLPQSGRIRSMRDAQEILHLGSLVLQGCVPLNPPLGSVINVPPGIYIVTLVGSNGVDQGVTINTTYRSLFYPAEEFPLALSADALRDCIGVTSKFRTICEVRSVLTVYMNARLNRCEAQPTRRIVLNLCIRLFVAQF